MDEAEPRNPEIEGIDVNEIPAKLCAGTFRLTKVYDIALRTLLASPRHQYKGGYLQKDLNFKIGQRSTVISGPDDLDTWKINVVRIKKEEGGTYLLWTPRSVYRFQVLNEQKPLPALPVHEEAIQNPRATWLQRLRNLFGGN